MAQAQVTVPYVEGPRNRGTIAIRLLRAIPHLIVMEIFGIAAFVVTVTSWFIQVFAGTRNEGMFNLAWSRCSRTVRSSPTTTRSSAAFPL